MQEQQTKEIDVLIVVLNLDFVIIIDVEKRTIL